MLPFWRPRPDGVTRHRIDTREQHAGKIALESDPRFASLLSRHTLDLSLGEQFRSNAERSELLKVAFGQIINH